MQRKARHSRTQITGGLHVGVKQRSSSEQKKPNQRHSAQFSEMIISCRLVPERTPLCLTPSPRFRYNIRLKCGSRPEKWPVSYFFLDHRRCRPRLAVTGGLSLWRKSRPAGRTAHRNLPDLHEKHRDTSTSVTAFSSGPRPQGKGVEGYTNRGKRNSSGHN